MTTHRIAAIAHDGNGTEGEPAMMVDVVIAHSFGRPEASQSRQVHSRT
jgi:hypothetical protein